jgi:hypothetical protein
VAWPTGHLPPATLGAIQQLRAEAAMRGLHQPGLPIEAGTVILEPKPQLMPSPGGRCVRVHPIASLDLLPPLLEPWRGLLQGAALGGAAARALGPALRRLGFSRLAACGELQSPDATWANGGIMPLEALASGCSDR